MMNPYGMDLSPFLDFDLSSDRLLQYSLHHEIQSRPSDWGLPPPPPPISPKRSPPRHRHDGTSPLPLGMDWSPPPRCWNGRDTVWPHDHRTGWSYCVTIPSWTIQSNSRGSAPVVFYRVQVGIQTPEGITTTREILHRFSDFLELYWEVRSSFSKKNLPLPPPRKLLGTKSEKLIEERRCSLEDWMEKLLSDIAISRSAPVAMFLDLEAAARSSFSDSSGYNSSSFPEFQASSGMSLTADASSVASDCADESGHRKSEIGTPRHGGSSVSQLSRGDSASDIDVPSIAEISGPSVMSGMSSSLPKVGPSETMQGCSATTQAIRDGSADGDVAFVTAGEISNSEASRAYDDSLSGGTEGPTIEDLQLPIAALPSKQRQKFNRAVVSLEQRLATAKAVMEDLVARLNQEHALREYLTTKVKDLEGELDTMKENTKDNLQRALSAERERFTKMQWDVEEFRKKCLEMELKLKYEQDEKVQVEAKYVDLVQENEMLMQELNAARNELSNLQKNHEESEVKSKTDVKVLIKEVKSLRTSQSELKQQVNKLMEEKLELERALQEDKQMRVQASTVNKKLVHECATLQKRLQECDVNYVIEDEGDRLTLDTASPSDVIDQLITCNNRIGLLLAEAQLLSQDVENSINPAERTPEDELRKLLADFFIDNATVRKQLNSVIRCALFCPRKVTRTKRRPQGRLYWASSCERRMWKLEGKKKY